MAIWFLSAKRAKRIQKARAGNSQEVLQRLKDYLNSEKATWEPVQLLCGFWQDQQDALTYQELRQAIEDGTLTTKMLELWQQDYSVLVSTKLWKMWENAILAGAGGQPLLDKISFSFQLQTPGIQNWIKERGAAFVTASTQEQKDAIAALLTKKMRDRHTVDELSRLIRPCIGLTKGDAAAAAKLYNSIVDTLTKEHPRMKPESIRKKALDRTLKYAERKHRARAMTIAQTESAFAYNRGADEGIRQAQAQGYLGSVVKRWSTSGDDQVCELCASLDGVEIGMDEDFKIGGRLLFPEQHRLPPAHPRCACAVEYVEVEDSVRQENTLTEFLGSVDLENTEETLKYLENEIRNADIEHMIAIDKDGNVFHSVGKEDMVFMSAVDFKGAIITHNHPKSEGIVSFGEDDFAFLREYQEIAELRCVNVEYDYSIIILKDISEITYNDLYKEAFQFHQEEDFEIQHKAMEILSERGYIRYVRKKFDKGTSG